MTPLEITIWDVNHGNAAYIKTPNGRHIVIDLGDTEEFSPLLEVKTRGAKQLDAVIVTHPHRDHLDEIFHLDQMNAQSFQTPWHLSEEVIRKANRSVDMPHIEKYFEVRRRCTFPAPATHDLGYPTNYGGAAFQVFQPSLINYDNINNHSLVAVVSYATSKMIIPGDNEAISWKVLLQDPAFVAAIKNADILLAPHHGREAGYCGELFEVMGKPKLVVISDGRFKDTSATGRYSNQATGWTVFDSAGTQDERKCLTTRCDGHITVKFGWSGDNPLAKPYMNVRTSNMNMSALMRGAFGL